jgi:hypothetical protein
MSIDAAQSIALHGEVQDTIICRIWQDCLWHGANTTTLLEKPIDAKQIPFYFEIKLPPPLKRGVDYGFKKRNTWIITED